MLIVATGRRRCLQTWIREFAILKESQCYTAGGPSPSVWLNTLPVPALRKKRKTNSKLLLFADNGEKKKKKEEERERKKGQIKAIWLQINGDNACKLCFCMYLQNTTLLSVLSFFSVNAEKAQCNQYFFKNKICYRLDTLGHDLYFIAITKSTNSK